MVKKLFKILLLIMLFPLIASAAIIMGGNTNTSVPYPIVITNTATSISVPTATLNGTAYNYNSTGTSYFNYGTTTAYGLQTTPIAFTGNTISTAFSGSASGLVTSTTYHFQACVTNAAGIACGGDLTFSTTGLGTMTRIGAFSGGTVGCNSRAHVIDTINRVGYVTCDLKVTKYNLDTLTTVGSDLLLIGAGWLGPLFDMSLNQSGQVLYISLDSSSTNNATYAIVNTGGASGSLSFNSYVYVPGLPSFQGSIGNVYDSAGNIFYFGRYTSNAAVGKVSGGSGVLGAYGFTSEAYKGIIGDFTNNQIYAGAPDEIHSGSPNRYIYRTNTALTVQTIYDMGVASGFTSQFALDITGNNLYFNGNNKLFKTPLTGFSVTQFGNPNSYVIRTVGIDVGLGYVYFGVDGSPARVGSIAISNFTQTSTLLFNSGENESSSINAVFHNIQIDTAAHVMYYLLSTTGVHVVKVQLN
jgi:hypothetical protein